MSQGLIGKGSRVGRDGRVASLCGAARVVTSQRREEGGEWQQLWTIPSRVRCATRLRQGLGERMYWNVAVEWTEECGHAMLLQSGT